MAVVAAEACSGLNRGDHTVCIVNSSGKLPFFTGAAMRHEHLKSILLIMKENQFGKALG
jgi:hypothetical protein